MGSAMGSPSVTATEVARGDEDDSSSQGDLPARVDPSRRATLATVRFYVRLLKAFSQRLRMITFLSSNTGEYYSSTTSI